MSLAPKLATLFGASGAQINAAHYQSFPVGVIAPYSGSVVPDGFLACAGQAVSRTTYAALWAVIGAIYGAGDGSTTFNLPDLRGRVPAGKDDMGGTAANRLTAGGAGVNGAALGGNGGAQTHALTVAQMPSHGHGISDPGHAHSVYDPGHAHGGNIVNTGAYQGFTRYSAEGDLSVGGMPGAGTGISIYAAGTGVSVAANGGSAAHPIVQPTLVIQYMIRAL